MRLRHILMVASVLLLAAQAATAQAPEGMFPEVSTAEVKKMMDGRVKFVLVDARYEDEYALGHIKGAINIPPEKLQFISRFLPEDKRLPVVFYCRGYG